MARREVPTPAISPEDAALFRSAVASARPLRTHPTVGAPRRRLPLPRHEAQGAEAGQALREPSDNELDLSEHLEFRRAGLLATDWRRLRRGEYPREAGLDLHGETVESARARLAGFLAYCQQAGLRCVHIVHGKGFRSPGQAAVLKPRVAFWLAHSDAVTAYVSARPAEGGTGALYVLIKRKRS